MKNTLGGAKTSLEKERLHDDSLTNIDRYRHSFIRHAEAHAGYRSGTHLPGTAPQLHILGHYTVRDIPRSVGKGTAKQLALFDQLCATSHVLSVTDDIIVRAATIYADLHQRGKLISDADIFIGATAIVHELVVATNNEAHFRRIRNLQIDNWLV